MAKNVYEIQKSVIVNLYHQRTLNSGKSINRLEILIYRHSRSTFEPRQTAINHLMYPFPIFYNQLNGRKTQSILLGLTCAIDMVSFSTWVTITC